MVAGDCVYGYSEALEQLECLFICGAGGLIDEIAAQQHRHRLWLKC
jgi:hypothetical protein